MIARSLTPTTVESALVLQVKLYKQGRGIARLRLIEVFIFVDEPRQIHTERHDRPTDASYLIRTQPDARQKSEVLGNAPYFFAPLPSIPLYEILGRRYVFCYRLFTEHVLAGCKRLFDET